MRRLFPALLSIAGLFLFASEIDAQTIRTVAQAAGVSGIAVDQQGNVFFSISPAGENGSTNAGANRIYERTASGDLRLYAGTGETGSRGDGGPATEAQFNFACQNAGRTSAIKTSANSLPCGGGLAVDDAGNLYVADTGNATIRRVDAATGMILNIAGPLGPPPDLRLVEPVALAVDQNSNVYIADLGANAIFVLRAESGLLGEFAISRSPLAVALDFPDAKLMNLRADSSLQAFPLADPRNFQALGFGCSHCTGFELHGIAVDGAGTVFVSNAMSNQIFRNSTPIAGAPEAGYSGDGGPAGDARLNAPGTMVFDRNGNLFFADTGNNAVREIERAGTPFDANPAIASNVTLNPPMLTFGAQPIGSPAPSQTITLTNNSGATLNFSNIGFAGPNAGDFASPPPNNCGLSIPAGGSCTITVTFMPLGTGARTAALQVTDSDATSPQNAPLSGTGDDYEIAPATSGSIMHSTNVQFVVSGATTADFSLSSSATSNTIAPGKSATYTITVAPLNKFTGSVALTVTGQVAGLTATLSASSITTSGNSTLTLAAASSLAPGTYQVTVTGVNGSITHSTMVQLIVSSSTSADYVLSASPSSSSIAPGASASYKVSISPLNGFNALVSLTASGLPAGASSFFDVNEIAGGTGSANLTIATLTTLPAGTYMATVTGASGALSQSVKQGQAATYSLEITPDAVFSGMVTIACPNQNLLPTGVTCTPNPAMLNVTAGQNSTFSVMLGTTAMLPPASRPTHDAPPLPLGILYACVLAGLCIFLIARRRRKAFRRILPAGFAFLVLCVVLTEMSACSHGGSKSNPNATGIGTFNITITADAQNATRAVTLQLTVNSK
ncbi:MAG: choice-of-anchor D domain-containing protein [Candidatus Acidiferrales bacterium]